MTLTRPARTRPATGRRVAGGVVAGVVAWVGLYWVNEHLWSPLLEAVGVDLASRTGEVVHFFLTDSIRILLLLVGLVFAVGVLRTWVRPERVRDFIAGRGLLVSLLLAAALGAVTPFCSCSSIPLFIGFVAAGVPVAVALTFLIASPLVNEVAVVMLGNSFGWELTATYVGSAMTLAVLAGLALSRVHLERWVADFVATTPVASLRLERPTLARRVQAARAETRQIVGRVWVWILVGVALGALVHGWVPAEVVTSYAGSDSPLGVVVATLLGVPLYANAAGVIPVAEALWAKGMATGTVMAFMMSTVALSLPELVLLKKVLRLPLLGIFVGAVTAGILLIGFLTNALF